MKYEDSILCPTNPYSATKSASELLSKSYYYSFDMPIIITRSNNIYGKNQYPEKLIPKFIKLLLNDKPVTIQGDGSQLRSFLHIDDLCDALKLILENGIIGEIYNIGSDESQEYSIIQVAHILIEKIKNTKDYNKGIEYIKDRPFNDNRYYISNQKVKNLGWIIKKDLINSLDELI